MAAKVSGPWDKYRNQRPSDVSPDRWDAYLDAQNEVFARLPNDGSREIATATINGYGAAAVARGLNTMTPEQQRSLFGKELPRPSSPQSVNTASTVGQIRDATARANAEDRRLVGNLEGEINTANMTDTNALGGLTNAQDAARAGYRGVAGQMRGTANVANDLSAQLFGGYAAGQAGLNAQDQAGYDRYIQETNPLMSRMTARSSDPADLQRQMGAYNMASGIAGGSLDYTAAQYASNPADVARQQQMYGALVGVGQGSLNYTADQWQSDPKDLQRQAESYQSLRDIGQGQLDYQSKAALAYADPESRANQKIALNAIQQDLKGGGHDQREVMEKFKALSEPTVTAKERFLSELARREFESSDRGSRAAQSEALANRGLRSGGSQLAATQATRQQLSQDRLLKELGIQAQAVDRSMQALGGWGTSANALRQGDQNALGMQANLTTAMRGQSFDEAYKRGIGADNASANNQATRLTGFQSSAQQSNAIRNANDMVGTFNTGQSNNAKANNQATMLSGYQGAATQSNAIRSANDAVGTFNTGQTNIARANNQSTRLGGAQLTALQSNAIRSANDSQRQFEDTFGQNEAVRVGNLAGQRAGEGRATTAQIGGRQTDVHNAGQGAIQDAYGRTSNADKADWDVVGADYGMATDYFDAVTGGANNRVNRAGMAAGIGMGATAAGTNRLVDALGIGHESWVDAEERSLNEQGW